MLSRGVLLLHDNAPVHTSRVSQVAIKPCGFEELNHPPYSPDLAPSDFYLFRKLKFDLIGTRFEDDDSLKAEIDAWLMSWAEKFYFSGIQALKSRWTVLKKRDIIFKIDVQIFVLQLQKYLVLKTFQPTLVHSFLHK